MELNCWNETSRTIFIGTTINSTSYCQPLSKNQQYTKRNGYRSWFPRRLRRQSSRGWRFNPDCKRVTIQEYLTLVSGYS